MSPHIDQTPYFTPIFHSIDLAPDTPYVRADERRVRPGHVRHARFVAGVQAAIAAASPEDVGPSAYRTPHVDGGV